MKLCKDCAFFNCEHDSFRGVTHNWCAHPKLPVDPVDGVRWRIKCLDMRPQGTTIASAKAKEGGYFCGIEGNLFEIAKKQ